MARCQHNSGNIQQFTDVCLDCGHNIWESDEEYDRIEREKQRYKNDSKKDNYNTNEGGW